MFGKLLGHVLPFPDEHYVYLVNGKPVLTFWGSVAPGPITTWTRCTACARRPRRWSRLRPWCRRLPNPSSRLHRCRWRGHGGVVGGGCCRCFCCCCSCSCCCLACAAARHNSGLPAQIWPTVPDVNVPDASVPAPDVNADLSLPNGGPTCRAQVWGLRCPMPRCPPCLMRSPLLSLSLESEPQPEPDAAPPLPQTSRQRRMQPSQPSQPTKRHLPRRRSRMSRKRRRHRQRRMRSANR